MKNTMSTILLLVGFSASAQTFTEKINKEVAFEKKSEVNAVLVANINGDIKIIGYEGDKVVLEVTKTINGKTDARLEKGKMEIKLGVLDRADTLIFYVEGACNNFGKRTSKHSLSELGGWGYNWNECNNERNCKSEYDYTMDFVLKVPAGVSVMVSTINDGEVTIQDVKGAVSANNINGGIQLTNVTRVVNASTINGDVNVDYSSNPDKDSRFYTLNGDINANFQKGLGARLTFESFNGDLYTNVARLEPLPTIVEKEQRSDGIRYKVNGNRFKVGNGGANLDFETFNGNVYVKEK